jgi:hypothetical protein
VRWDELLYEEASEKGASIMFILEKKKGEGLIAMCLGSHAAHKTPKSDNVSCVPWFIKDKPYTTTTPLTLN